MFSKVIKAIWKVFWKYRKQSDGLAGRCCRASMDLLLELLEFVDKEDLQLVYITNDSDGHVCVLWRGYYLDCTAEQFGHRGVYIGRTPFDWTSEPCIEMISLNRHFSDNCWLWFGQWSKDQRPNGKIVRKIGRRAV